jgi:hypothetical protein
VALAVSLLAAFADFLGAGEGLGPVQADDMYGKSPVTLRLDVSGGVGHIDLRPMPKGQ